MKTVSSIVLAATLLTVVSCGNKTSHHSAAPKTEEQKVDQLKTVDGHYLATFSPINAHLAGDVSGTAMVKIKGDSMTFEVKVNGAPAQIMHAQSIQLGTECPTLSSDMNNDGVIDAVEGQKSYGKVIIPLDNNLMTQIEADVKYPSADFSGNYFYRQMISMAEMTKDLMAMDMNTTDNVVKLQNGLSLEGRQVVIYGVAKNAALPETVASMNDQTNYSSLPIACGSLTKIAVEEEGTNTNGGKDE